MRLSVFTTAWAMSRKRSRVSGRVASGLSLLTHDFSVLYVAENNATTTPPFISAISLWAALEGSILFWAFLATGWAALVLWRHRDRHRLLMPWVGAALASVNLFFFAVMTWPGNPFTRTDPVASQGLGPNALLQNHPFMALHPPLLYLGYTGLAVPFAFGVAAEVELALQGQALAPHHDAHGRIATAARRQGSVSRRRSLGGLRVCGAERSVPPGSRVST